MLSFRNALSFEQGTELLASLVHFWEPEDGFAWSTGRWCEIRFPFEVGAGLASLRSADLILDLDAYRPEGEGGQNALFYLNGLRIGSAVIAERANCILPFSAKLLQGSENVLTIDTPDSCSPQRFGSTDNRVLGVKLFSVQIRRG